MGRKYGILWPFLVIFLFVGIIISMAYYGDVTRSFGTDYEIILPNIDDDLPPKPDQKLVARWSFVSTKVVIAIDVENFYFALVEYEHTRITFDGYKKVFALGGTEYPGSNVGVSVECNWYQSGEISPEAERLSNCTINVWGDRIMTVIKWNREHNIIHMWTLDIYGNGPMQGINANAGRGAPVVGYVTLLVAQQLRLDGTVANYGFAGTTFDNV